MFGEGVQLFNSLNHSEVLETDTSIPFGAINHIGWCCPAVPNFVEEWLGRLVGEMCELCWGEHVDWHTVGNGREKDTMIVSPSASDV